MFCLGASASERLESLPDMAPPVAVAVSIESSPQQGRDTYRIGETISIAVTFNEPVAVDESVGTPSLALTVGDRERHAIYSNGSNTTDLVFRYRIADGDMDSDGIAVPADGLALNGAMRDAAENPARLKSPAMPDQPGHRIDGQRPAPVPSQAISVAGSEVSIAFDEPLDEGSIPAIDSFSVVGQEAAYSVQTVSVQGDSVWLALSPAVPDAESFVSVTYTEPVYPSAHSLRDTVGNAAASFVSDWYAETPDFVDAASRTARKARAAEKQRIGEILAKKALRTPAERKVSSRLLEGRRKRQDPPERAAGTQMRDERVMVDIRADVTPEVLRRIRALGGKILDQVPRYRSIRARLTPEAAVALAELDAVQTIRPADEARTRQATTAGSAFRAAASKANTSEGDRAHCADSARSTYGVDGTGIGIGVISNGVRTLADRQASGDLPGRVTVLPGQAGSGDEGTAILEIVHDLAPGAELYFATGSGGQARFASNIEALCDAGANVIVDDIGYADEAVFQDDLIAQGVNAAVADGCYYFSAAGNNGNLNDGTSGVWEGDYDAGSALMVEGENVGVRHEFESGTEENTLAPGSFGFGGIWSDFIVLQWADPGGASANDYDLFLIDADGNVVGSSTNTQDGSQDPIEVIDAMIFSDDDVRLVVVKASGSDRYLRLQVFGGQLEIATAGNTFGHSAAENAFGIGQVDVRTAGGTGGVFNGTESVLTDSSDGPRRVFFEPDGTAITAGNFSSTGGKLLSKPDLAAAGCVTTATPGFSPFCGTSAAAPHAAAIAALALEGAGGPGNVSQAQLRTATASMALDIEATGADRDSGAGIAMAPAAVNALDIARESRNEAPTVGNVQNDRTVAPGSDAIEIDLDSVFSDPDMDTLAYGGLSSDIDRLEISVSGSTVTLTPGSPGRVVVVLRAVDPEGLNAVESFTVTVSAGNQDYDSDNDGLIDVSSVTQLDAMRYDLNGDGIVDGAIWQAYYDAFPSGALEMGCPADGCTGYELNANLDFDTDSSGAIDSGDTYWNGGAGWDPIGDEGAPFDATFEGNGVGIDNLFIQRGTEDGVGLFGYVGDDCVLRGVRLTNVQVTGQNRVGSLFGSGVYPSVPRNGAAGKVTGNDEVGGLVGRTWGVVEHSYAAVNTSGAVAVGGLVGHQMLNRIETSYATGNVSGQNSVGGLVGASSDFIQDIRASYATGFVSGTGARLPDMQSVRAAICRFGATEHLPYGGGVGGLVGGTCGGIEASYATGAVSGDAAVGGLVGTAVSLRTIASYWDIDRSGSRVGVGANDTNDNGLYDGTELRAIGLAGQTTTDLQSPVDYAGIYELWNLDLDGDFGDGVADDPWDFGTSAQYPVLSVDHDRNMTATWQEFGYQVRTAPLLTASTTDGQAQVDLSWTAPDTQPWSPAPSVSYTLYRKAGTTVEAVATALATRTYSDTGTGGVTLNSRNTYWVAAVMDGGEFVRSAPVSLTVGTDNQPPIAAGVLAGLELEVGGAAETVDVSGAFQDPDDDALTFSASLSVTGVATVATSGSMVTVTPQSAGDTILTVTATDADGSNSSATQRFTVTVGYNYDSDGDGLIEIDSLAQLDAVRHDVNGDGRSLADEYGSAFPSPFDWMGCGFEGCLGYELDADLDFDTDGSGVADAGDTYWNDGDGWVPIGSPTGSFFGTTLGAFNGTFEGNGHTLANLFVSRGDYAGLFGALERSARVVDLRLSDVDVTGKEKVGGLAGENVGRVIGAQVSGRVAGERHVGGVVGLNLRTIVRASSSAAVTGMDPARVIPPNPPSGISLTVISGPLPGTGGVVGYNTGWMVSNYATGPVTGDMNVGGLVGSNERFIGGSYATAHVTGRRNVGGLIGWNASPLRVGTIIANYATGRVEGSSAVGGLVGSNDGEGTVSASYATARVAGVSNEGGLVGHQRGVGSSNDPVTASYWDTLTSGHTSSSTGLGKTTAQLQSPESYSGIYRTWNIDLDLNGTNDDPWHLGENSEYPALNAYIGVPGTATWEELGYQLRDGPDLTVSTDTDDPVLTWTAVDASAWDPEPTVVYTVIRGGGAELEAIASGLETLTYTDSGAIEGETYDYQIAAGVGVGEAVRSTIVEVTVPVPDTTPPSVKSIESDATHPTKDPFKVTITFTKSVTGLTGSEIGVTNGTASDFAGSGPTRTLTVTPDADFEGDVTVTVPAGVAEDSAMNANEAGSATFSVDTLAPAFAATDAAVVSGATLTLTFDAVLAAARVPNSAFTVTGATTRSVTGVSVSGATVQLTLSVPVLHGESGIEVDYTAPSREALADAAGNKVASFEDRAVSNDTPATTLSTSIGLSLNTASITEGGGAKTVTVTGTLNRAARPAATDVTIEVGTVGDTATEGTDYTAVDDLTLTFPAYSTSGTASFTLTPSNDRIDEVGESLTVTGSTAVSGLSVTPSAGLAIDILDNDAAPSLVLLVSASAIDEDGGTATVTVSTGSGSTFASDRSVQLAVAGTATETADYTISGKTLTLPAGMGTSTSMVAATVTGVDDSLDDDDETIVITGSRNGVAFGSRQTVAITDDDWPALTVTFRQLDYRVAEGGHVDLPITLIAVPERQVTIPVEVEGVDGAEAIDYAVTPTSLTFGANETDKTVRVSASNDSLVDPGESVTLRFGSTLPDRITEGGIAETSVAIRDTDFTFVPAFAVGAGTTETATDIYTVSEAESALRLSLSLETPSGVRVEDIVDPVVVTLATRENAGTQGTDEAYAAQRRIGTFGDYDALNQDISFAPTDFSDEATCGCARADKAVSVDLFDDRTYERTEVFGLRVARRTGRLSVSSRDITVKVGEDDPEPVLTLDIDPAAIAEAGGTSAVTVSNGSGSTFPTAQTIDLDISGTATENTDFEIDAKRLTLPAGTGMDASSVETTVRALDDAIDDDAETIVLSALRGGTEFENRTLTITDDETGSTRVDLSVNPAQVREDAGATTVRVTASLDADARAENTEVTVTVGTSGDSAVEGTDYQTVADLTLTIDAGDTSAETTFTLTPTNNDSVEGAKTITLDGSVSGLAVRSADLTLNDDDVASTTVVLTLDPLEVSENAGSRPVRVTGTLDGGARITETVVTLTVGSGTDSALEGTDYAEIPDLQLTIPGNQTDGTVTFTLRPTNDRTSEGTETISVSGTVAGLTVTPAELTLADDDSPSIRLDLSLNPSTVSEGAAPTEVVVTGSLNAGARTSEAVVSVTVGSFTDSATEGDDYANVGPLQITVLANATNGQTMFTLSLENDAIAEGAEVITVSGTVSGLTVEPATLTLSDNDTESRVVELSVEPQRVSEDTPEDITVTASLNAGARATDTEIRVNVGATGDTAVPGTDYERVSEQTLSILAGETSASTVFHLVPIDNRAGDEVRTLSVTGSTTVAVLRVDPANGAQIALDDDDNPGVRVTPETLTVVESASAIYSVALQTRPTEDVTVRIGGVDGDLSLDRTSLVFTQADWRIRQDVTVTAADDDDKVQDADVMLTHRASGAAEYRGLSADLVVTIRENDPSLVFSDTTVSVPEGETATYTVALATVPTANVTVRATGVSGDLSLNPTRLEFTPGDWDEPQTVTVEAAEDDDASTDPAVTLTYTASGGGYDNIVGEVRVSVLENDGGGSGGGGGGGAANIPPVVEREIEDQTLDAGEVLELDITLNFYDRNQRALDYSVTSSDPSVAVVTVNRQGVLTIEGHRRGVTAVTVTAADRRDERASDTFLVTVRGPALVALVPRAADLMREGFVRVINHDDEAGEVSIEAIDDTGMRYGPVTLSLDAGETQHFNSGDLEDGNAAKGLPDGVGPGEGDWRLVLDSELDIEVLAYIRTEDGLLTAMHDTVPVRDGTYEVAIFNPGSNANQVSRLRLTNPGEAPAQVTVTGTDDAGASPGASVMFEIPAGESLTLSASDLEAGAGVDGALGDGQGKWRLRVTSNEPIVAMSLLSSPTGHLTNLSTVPSMPDDENGVHVVPLFPPAADPLGRQGFVRVVNRSTEEGTVQIEAHDDSDLDYEAVTLSMGAGATVHFNSNDLELGNTAKGLSGSTGAGVGNWRLVLSSERDIDVLAYIRTTDGFLTSMHDVAPSLEGVHRVVIFNPGSNPNQVSGLRLVNPGSEDAEVAITGVDDAGASPGSAVRLTVPAGSSRTILATDLESGGEGLAGALGDGVGKWRLTVDSDQPIVVMSLLSSPTGHLTNLSTAPQRGEAGEPAAVPEGS